MKMRTKPLTHTSLIGTSLLSGLMLFNFATGKERNQNIINYTKRNKTTIRNNNISNTQLNIQGDIEKIPYKSGFLGDNKTDIDAKKIDVIAINNKGLSDNNIDIRVEGIGNLNVDGEASILYGYTKEEADSLYQNQTSTLTREINSVNKEIGKLESKLNNKLIQNKKQSDEENRSARDSLRYVFDQSHGYLKRRLDKLYNQKDILEVKFYELKSNYNAFVKISNQTDSLQNEEIAKNMKNIRKNEAEINNNKKLIDYLESKNKVVLKKLDSGLDSLDKSVDKLNEYTQKGFSDVAQGFMYVNEGLDSLSLKMKEYDWNIKKLEDKIESRDLFNLTIGAGIESDLSKKIRPALTVGAGYSPNEDFMLNFGMRAYPLGNKENERTTEIDTDTDNSGNMTKESRITTTTNIDKVHYMDFGLSAEYSLNKQKRLSIGAGVSLGRNNITKTTNNEAQIIYSQNGIPVKTDYLSNTETNKLKDLTHKQEFYLKGKNGKVYIQKSGNKYSVGCEANLNLNVIKSRNRKK